MTAIGTVIEEGDQIPEDVTGMFDRDDDPWFLLENGHWHAATAAIQSCLRGECITADNDPMEFAPLFVAAVRS